MRLIDADALQLAIVEEGQANKRKKYIIGDIWELTGAEIREVINSQPTIQPEIIRCKDCISRQAAIDALNKLSESTYEVDYGVVDCDDAINAIVALPPTELRRGKWIDRGEHGDWEWQADGRGKHWHEWECNTCHHYFAERSFFCPHCGSDMREETT